jgi:hypothetical protein
LKSSESIPSQIPNVRAKVGEYVREDIARHARGAFTPVKNTRKADIRKSNFETEAISHGRYRVFISGSIILFVFLVLGGIRWQLAFDHAGLLGYSDITDAVPQVNHPATEGGADRTLNLGEERNQAMNMSAYPSPIGATEMHPETSRPLNSAVMAAADDHPDTMGFPDLQRVAYVIAGKTRLPEYIWAPASMERSQMINHGKKLSILETTGKRMANDEATVEDRQAHFETKIDLMEEKIGLIQKENEQLTGEIDNNNFETYRDQIEFNENVISQLETEVMSSREVLEELR